MALRTSWRARLMPRPVGHDHREDAGSRLAGLAGRRSGIRAMGSPLAAARWWQMIRWYIATNIAVALALGAWLAIAIEVML